MGQRTGQGSKANRVALKIVGKAKRLLGEATARPDIVLEGEAEEQEAKAIANESGTADRQA